MYSSEPTDRNNNTFTTEQQHVTIRHTITPKEPLPSRSQIRLTELPQYLRNMRQISILPSGCQLSNLNCLLFFSESRIFYASSLAVYVLDPNTFDIIKVLSIHQKSITSISVSPHDENLLIVSGADSCVCVWNVEEEEVVARITVPGVTCVAWDPIHSGHCGILQGPGVKLCSWYVLLYL
jgi:WD40 repeat protein